MNNLNYKDIIIKGLELKEGVKNGNHWSKIILISDQDKYSIWIKKQDGTLTKAFNQLKSLGFPINKKVKIAFDIKDASFTNKDGKEIGFKDKTIAFFGNINETIEEPEIEDEINLDEIPF